jgi:hypothetical protein
MPLRCRLQRPGLAQPWRHLRSGFGSARATGPWDFHYPSYEMAYKRLQKVMPAVFQVCLEIGLEEKIKAWSVGDLQVTGV